MRPRIKFQKNGTSVPFFFFARYPKSKMNSRIVMPRQKQNYKIKKFFSRNTPPGLFYPSKHTKSIVRLLLTIRSKGIATPTDTASREWAARP
jgi:hypothetical protein